MVDASTYAPTALKVAQLDPNEQHLHSFIIFPYVYEKRGGMFLKFAAWHSENTRYFLHLTDWRMIIEPYERNTKEKLLTQGVLMLAGTVVGGSGAETAIKIGANALKSGDKKLAADKGRYAFLEYSEVDKVESFRQGLGTLIRIVLKEHPSQPVVFQVSAARQSLSPSLGCATEFLQVVNGLCRG